MASKKKTSGTTHQVTTPNNPTWVEPAIQGLQSKIGSTFAGLDPQSLVAGPDALQTQAAQGAAGLGMPSALGEAEGAFRGLGSARSIDGIGDYMSPYLKNVVDTSLADYDYGAGQTRAQDALARAGDSTFGGSGGSIQTALSNDALTRGRAGLSAGLYDQGFGRATSLASGDLNRRLQAASGLAGVGQAQGAEARANLGTQMDIGGILQRLAQAKAQAKVTALGQETALTAGLPYGLFQGQTTDGKSTGTQSGLTSGDLLGFFAANARAAAGAAGG